MKRYSLFGLMLFLYLSAAAQPLQRGTIFPDQSLDLTKDFKHIPIILDFFTAYCPVCFASMPHANELQQKFKGQIRFLLIGYDQGNVRSVYEKFKTKFDLRLEVRFDTVVAQQYKIQPFPRYVWIDRNGIVQAVTGPYKVTEKNVLNFIETGIMYDTDIERYSFDRNKPYLINGNGGLDSNFLFRSLLTSWDESSPISTPSHIDFRVPYFQALGVTALSLYKLAYLGANDWDNADSLYGNVFPQPILLDSGIQHEAKRYYCYSVTVPLLDRYRMRNILQNDLENYFGWEARVESRMMPYWRLICNGECDHLKSKATAERAEGTRIGFSLTRHSVSAIVDLLHSNFQNGPPFIDETGIDFPIDIKVSAILSDFDEFRNALRQNGLDLVEGKRMMKVLVIGQRMNVVSK
ncbi:MAG: TlpA disulfide reductase family protein [Bacteroidota bacterium]|nr:TlpA disulfide reductase family protein [Bacteroidota bacterium]